MAMYTVGEKRVVPLKTVDLTLAVDLEASSVSGGQKYKSTVPPVKVHLPQSLDVTMERDSNLHVGVGPVGTVIVSGVKYSGMVVTVTFEVGDPSAYTGVIVVGVT